MFFHCLVRCFQLSSMFLIGKNFDRAATCNLKDVPVLALKSPWSIKLFWVWIKLPLFPTRGYFLLKIWSLVFIGLIWVRFSFGLYKLINNCQIILHQWYINLQFPELGFLCPLLRQRIYFETFGLLGSKIYCYRFN